MDPADRLEKVQPIGALICGMTGDYLCGRPGALRFEINVELSIINLFFHFHNLQVIFTDNFLSTQGLLPLHSDKNLVGQTSLITICSLSGCC